LDVAGWLDAEVGAEVEIAGLKTLPDGDDLAMPPLPLKG
jgi:hypothetical protein